MIVFVPIAMFGWVPLTIVFFMVMEARKAAVASLVLGWLFLPGAIIPLPGIPDYTKVVAVCLPIILSTVIFDFKRLKKLSLSRKDIPIIVFCCSAFASSISNDLGLYDGASHMLDNVFQWGFPYAIGKMYFSDSRGIRDLAIWVVIGGLIYIPFCLWEMRMSPNLHFHLYGFRTDRFLTTMRFGGYRPVVFLQHGTALGVWMMSSVLMAMFLLKSKLKTRLFGLSMRFHVSILLLIFLLCRSLNSFFLFLFGCCAYFLIRSRRWKIIILCLALMPVAWIMSRNVGIINAENLLEIVSIIDEDRAESLAIRLYHEQLLMEKAWERPIFGWGGWGRNRIFNEYGEDISITDGLWILIFGIFGLVGLISLGMVLLWPTIVFWRRYRHLDWLGHTSLAPIVGFVVFLPLHTIDCLMNAFVNPIYIAASGAILGWMATAESDPAFLKKA